MCEGRSHRLLHHDCRRSEAAWWNRESNHQLRHHQASGSDCHYSSVSPSSAAEQFGPPALELIPDTFRLTGSQRGLERRRYSAEEGGGGFISSPSGESSAQIHNASRLSLWRKRGLREPDCCSLGLKRYHMSVLLQDFDSSPFISRLQDHPAELWMILMTLSSKFLLRTRICVPGSSVVETLSLVSYIFSISSELTRFCCGQTGFVLCRGGVFWTHIFIPAGYFHTLVLQ